MKWKAEWPQEDGWYWFYDFDTPQFGAIPVEVKGNKFYRFNTTISKGGRDMSKCRFLKIPEPNLPE